MTAAEATGRARPMQIGVVAERTEMSIRTLRHYDEVGLVTPSARSEGGFRLYTEADVARILVIRRMKPLEFTLEEMGRLLDSLDTLADPRSDAGARATAKDFIADCHTRAVASTARLRKHLAYAEELTGILAQKGSELSHV